MAVTMAEKLVGHLVGVSVAQKAVMRAENLEYLMVVLWVASMVVQKVAYSADP